MKKHKKHFRDFVKEAEAISEDPEKINVLSDRVKEKVLRNKSKLGKVLVKIRLLLRLLKAYASGRYKQIQASRIILVMAALIYIVSPIDAIFDFLPGGYIDDAAIVIWLFNVLSEEIESFRKWEIEQGIEKV
jgi:uncharacterized membrane protein YkvA (DUF1232 family)